MGNQVWFSSLCDLRCKGSLIKKQTNKHKTTLITPHLHVLMLPLSTSCASRMLVRWHHLLQTQSAFSWDYEHHLCAGCWPREWAWRACTWGLLQTTVPPAAGKWSAPGHPATALSPAGFNEVKRSQDSSMGTARVISYLWRCELCLCYCLHTFLFWCPVTQCAHWKKENYNYTHKSLWELRALLKPVFSSVLQCFLGSMKVFYFLLLLQHTDEMYSIFVFVFYRFPLQLLHTRKHFPIFPAL